MAFSLSPFSSSPASPPPKKTTTSGARGAHELAPRGRSRDALGARREERLDAGRGSGERQPETERRDEEMKNFLAALKKKPPCKLKESTLDERAKARNVLTPPPPPRGGGGGRGFGGGKRGGREEIFFSKEKNLSEKSTTPAAASPSRCCCSNDAGESLPGPASALGGASPPLSAGA